MERELTGCVVEWQVSGLVEDAEAETIGKSVVRPRLPLRISVFQPIDRANNFACRYGYCFRR